MTLPHGWSDADDCISPTSNPTTSQSRLVSPELETAIDHWTVALQPMPDTPQAIADALGPLGAPCCSATLWLATMTTCYVPLASCRGR